VLVIALCSKSRRMRVLLRKCVSKHIMRSLQAVSSITVASDRSCIHSNGTFRGILSIEDVLGCCKVCGNCYGGDPLKGSSISSLKSHDAFSASILGTRRRCHWFKRRLSALLGKQRVWNAMFTRRVSRK
jgi:hypothetical protein